MKTNNDLLAKVAQRNNARQAVLDDLMRLREGTLGDEKAVALNEALRTVAAETAWLDSPELTAPVYLLETFKRGVESVLAPDELDLCRRIAAESESLSRAERQVQIACFLTDKYRNDAAKAQTVSNYIENYLSTMTSLVFSCDAVTPPQDYYRPAPSDFSSVIVAFRDKPIIMKAEWFSDKAWYGKADNRAGRLISLKVFTMSFTNETPWELLYDASVIDTSYPHISTLCHKDDCPHANQLVVSIADAKANRLTEQADDLAGFVECRLTERKSAVCLREITSKDLFGLTIKDFYAIAVMCFEKWRDRPKTTRSPKPYDDGGVAAVARVEPIKPSADKLRFHEVRLSEYASKAAIARKSGYKIENRLSPCEHVRREHTRKLKSGKVVQVKSAVIGKGNSKAVYAVS